jgi:hypothetical protein
VAGKQSKTSRASVRAGAGAGGAGNISALGEVKFIIPLNRGRNAYVRNISTGQTVNLKTNSDAFIEQIRTLAAAGQGAKLRAEFEQLAADLPDEGWDATLKRLEDAEALSAPA